MAKDLWIKVSEDTSIGSLLLLLTSFFFLFFLHHLQLKKSNELEAFLCPFCCGGNVVGPVLRSKEAKSLKGELLLAEGTGGEGEAKGFAVLLGATLLPKGSLLKLPGFMLLLCSETDKFCMPAITFIPPTAGDEKPPAFTCGKPGDAIGAGTFIGEA